MQTIERQTANPIRTSGRLKRATVKFDPSENASRHYHYKKKDKQELSKDKKKGKRTSGSIELSTATLKPSKKIKKVPKKPVKAAKGTISFKKPTAADDKNESKIKRRRRCHYSVEDGLVDSPDPIHESIDAKRRRCQSVVERSIQFQEQHSASNETGNNTDQEEDIPDVTEWSSDEIFNYFHEIFPQHAHVLKDQEINGRSIYLLQRNDIIKEFALKVGPALEIYALILKLKSKKLQS